MGTQLERRSKEESERRCFHVAERAGASLRFSNSEAEPDGKQEDVSRAGYGCHLGVVELELRECIALPLRHCFAPPLVTRSPNALAGADAWEEPNACVHCFGEKSCAHCTAFRLPTRARSNAVGGPALKGSP